MNLDEEHNETNINNDESTLTSITNLDQSNTINNINSSPISTTTTPSTTTTTTISEPSTTTIPIPSTEEQVVARSINNEKEKKEEVVVTESKSPTTEQEPSSLIDTTLPTIIESINVTSKLKDTTQPVVVNSEERSNSISNVATNEVKEVSIPEAEETMEISSIIELPNASIDSLAASLDPLALESESIPISSIPTTTLLSSNPNSTTSTPTLATAILPGTIRSNSPALPVKKFASSLSVNKKFLEKAAEKSKPEVKASVARTATPPIAPLISTTHPRLFTGKITAPPPTSSSATNAAAGVSGWLKNVAAAEGNALGAPRSVSMDMGRLGAYDRSRGGGIGMSTRGGRQPIVWGSGNRHSGSMDSAMGFGGDFPTAAEAANAKIMRAAAVLEQIQSRDRAIQARAAAAAAANAHLLEGLDAFRGVHLDPNASHWDEMGDEDNDFLDDTIEFGDGTQYKIDAEVAPPLPSGLRNEQYLDEPDPSDFATLEAPLAPGESIEEPNREERFQDDYDRSWSKRVVPEDNKNLFNERLGKFEPYAGGKKGAVPGAILSHSAEDIKTRRLSGVDHPPHLDKSLEDHPHSNRRPSITSPRLEKATLPPRRESAWGNNREQIPGRGTDWNTTGSGPVPRRSSIEQGVRRPSIDHTTRRPSIDQGGRQLPPHLAGIQQSPRNDRHELPPHRSLPPHQIPPHQQAAILPTTAHTLSSITSVIASPPTILAPIPVSPLSITQAIPNLEELHSREMHAAAERAKKRRQEEEAVRMEQVERARKKADELEEKARLIAEAKLEASKPNLSVVENSAVPGRTSEWRKPSVKVEPTRILTREAPLAPISLTTPTSPSFATPPPVNSAPTQSLRPEQKLWKRGDPAPAIVNRQPPPHLSGTSKSTITPPTTLPSPTIESSSEQSSSPTTQANITSPLNGNRKPVGELLNAYKEPRLAGLEDVMSRIKGAMVVPTIPASTHASDNSPKPLSSSTPSSTGPTVKLPGILPTSSAISSSSKGPSPPLGPKGRGRNEVRPVVRPVATFENRDPLPLFEATRGARSQSPPPAWKVYPVRLAPYATTVPPSNRSLTNTGPPPGVESISYNPKFSSTPRPSRDDHLFTKRYHKGIVVKAVYLPKRRIIQSTVIIPAPPSAHELEVARRRALPPVVEPNWRKEVKVEAVVVEIVAEISTAVSIPMRSSPSANFNATTAPPTDSLFDPSPSRFRPLPTVAPSVELKVVQTIVPVAPSSEILESSRFTLTGALNGEEVKTSPRESLAAPGADLATVVTSVPLSGPFDSPTVFAATLPTTPVSSWPAPLSLSVLDPTLPSVWSAPPTESPSAHVRSISLGGIKLENSLHGIADDDFQPAIPTSLADLKTEEEGAVEGQALRSRVESDEARLRNVAPSFATSFEGVNSSPGQALRRQESFNRQQPPHSQYANNSSNYSTRPFMPSQIATQTPHYANQQINHLYPNFTSPIQTGGPSYSLSNYSQTSYSPISPINNQAPHHFPNYRTPSLTNTSIVSQGYGASSSSSSYGPVGPVGQGVGGGSYGAVGATGMQGGSASGVLGGGVRLGGSPFSRPQPQMNGNYQQPYNIGISSPYRDNAAFSSPQASRFGGSIGGGGNISSPSSMSHLQSQPSNYSSPYSMQQLQLQQQQQQQQLQLQQQQQLRQQQQFNYSSSQSQGQGSNARGLPGSRDASYGGGTW